MARSLLFRFKPAVELDEAETTLHLAMFAVEGLVGRARLRLEAHYEVDAETHSILVDTRTRTGRLVAHIYAGFLLREFGEDAFCVEHLEQLSAVEI
ncbi:MAG: hypothetical protein KatS3mg109_0665 [Pirellulaceae bacterium]|nr:MAG: hypothetical protein KatS3mg109_0665 [Pirellulaceae bacterium]